MTSLSFERAATFYDATRRLPDEAMEQIITMLAAELDGRGRCLEIGVGTGRIALRLGARGIPMTGADIAPGMLGQLVTSAGGTAPFPLMLADATSLPLPAGSLGGVVACHVLHLIPGWRTAVNEAMRVLRPGGVLLTDFGVRRTAQPVPDGPSWAPAVNEILTSHDIRWQARGAASVDEVAAYLGDRVGHRALPPVPAPYSQTLRTTIESFEQQIYSWTWHLPAAHVRAAGAQIRQWAQRTGTDLDAESAGTHHITWHAFSVS